jgi:hypothetical protein
VAASVFVVHNYTAPPHPPGGAQAADKFFILSTGHSTTGLDAVVEVTGDEVKMTRPIEDLVFDEK